MEISTIIKDFQKKVSNHIQLFQEGKDRFRISNPFMFNDGDHYVILLKKRGKYLHITDEGHTFMHLSYYIDMNDINKGTRQNIIENTLSMYDINDDSGILNIEVAEDNYGDALFSFIQGISKITDINYLTRERIKSSFLDDFRIFLEENIPQERIYFHYNIPEYDPDGMYPIDCRINGMPTPLFLFAVNNDNKCKDVTINLLQYKKWNINHHSIAIFEEQETISRKALARFSDVCDKQFSNLPSNKNRINDYLKKQMG